MQEVIAGWLGVDVGRYVQVADSLHVYERDISNVLNSAATPPIIHVDSLAVPKPLSEALFAELGRRLYILRRTDLTRRELQRAANWDDVTEAFENILRVLASESARRRGMKQLAAELMEDCTNPVYRMPWQRWITRVDPSPSSH